jgi:heat shock protein HslJ
MRRARTIEDLGPRRESLKRVLGQYLLMSCDLPLIGERWFLIEILLEGRSIPDVPAARPDITFDADGRMFGHGGCNRYFGGYKVEGDRISFTAIGSTMMYCQDTMVIEQAFLQSLGLVTLIDCSDADLELRSDDGKTRLSFQREQGPAHE